MNDIEYNYAYNYRHTDVQTYTNDPWDEVCEDL